MTDDPSSNLSTDPIYRWRRAILGVIIAVAAACSLADLLTVNSPMQSANDRSRWCTVWSLVHKGTYQIDEIIQKPGWDTIDKVRKDGHFYSSKPPLLSTMVAGVYWPLHRFLGWDLAENPQLVIPVILAIVNWLPWILALGLFARLFERHSRTNFTRFFLLIAAAKGTLLTPFLVTFNNHTVAAVSVLIAVTPIVAVLQDDRRGPWRFAISGFAAAFAVCNELPACVFGAALFGLLVWKAPRQTLLFFVPAALVPLAAFFVTNWLCTGGWKPFQSQYGTELYRYVHEGVPSYWMNPQGIDQNKDSPLVYFLHCTIGHHGILSLTPLFLLLIPGWWAGLQKSSNWRWLAALSLGLTVWVLGFYMFRTENYNYGGNTSGLRWAFWLIPLWLLVLMPICDLWSDRTAFRWAAMLLLAVSAFSAAMPQDNPWQPPWLQVVMQQFQWVDYKSPQEEHPPRKVWLGSVPQNDGASVEFSGTSPGGPVRLELKTTSHAERDGRMIREFTVTREESGAKNTLTLLVDEQALAEGQSAAACLDHPAWGQTPWEDVAKPPFEAKTFLEGLPVPGKASYAYRLVRYVKTPLRTDAFRCRQYTAQTDVRVDPKGEMLRHRRDVWLCDEIPFGVLQFEDTVSERDGGAILYKQRFQVSRFGVRQ